MQRDGATTRLVTATILVSSRAEMRPRAASGVPGTGTRRMAAFVEAMQLVCNMLYCSDNEEVKT